MSEETRKGWLGPAAWPWLLLTVALLSVALFTTALLRKDFAAHLADAEHADHTELDLLAQVVGNALQQARFEDVATTVASWGSRHPSIAELRVTANNGFVLGSYRRALPATRKHELETRLDYGYRDSATLYLCKDLGDVYAARNALSAEVAVLLTTLSGLLAYLVYVSAKRREAVTALRALTSRLEQRVRERTAELEASNEELRAFSYSVAHDLRTPLRALHGYADLLVDEYGSRLDTQGLDYLERIRQASRKLAQLIDELLYLAKIARENLRKSPLDLSQLVRDVAAELHAAEPDRAIVFQIADGVTVNGDAALLRIAVMNLLGNAMKFTRGRSDAHIVFGQLSEHGERTYFIRDNGVGFDMAFADKLFIAFQRLHNEPKYEGTGIGLSLVARIIQRHGGRIWAQSTPDQGATFFFTLPA